MSLEYKVGIVDWLDAADHKDIELKDIIDDMSSKYFVARRTIGFILRDDKNGVIIATDIREGGYCEITAIPRKMLREVTYSTAFSDKR